MFNFLNLEYDGDAKLTHEEFSNYLSLKNIPHINHVNIRKIKNHDILTGRYIFVKDDIGRIIPYERPIVMSLKQKSR